MFKNKLIAAGILSVSALALSVPAMAGGLCITDSNYRGRYACHEQDGAGTISSTNDVGGVTGSYVLYPNGWGGYWSGEIVVNASALWGNNPCVFDLETSGDYVSSY
jgi:hypothetical protein